MSGTSSEEEQEEISEEARTARRFLNWIERKGRAAVEKLERGESLGGRPAKVTEAEGEDDAWVDMHMTEIMTSSPRAFGILRRLMPCITTDKTLAAKRDEFLETHGVAAAIDVSLSFDPTATAKMVASILEEVFGDSWADIVADIPFKLSLDEVKVAEGLWVGPEGRVYGVMTDEIPEGGIYVRDDVDVAYLAERAAGEDSIVAKQALGIVLMPLTRRVEDFPPLLIDVIMVGPMRCGGDDFDAEADPGDTDVGKTGAALRQQVQAYVNELMTVHVAVYGLDADNAGEFQLLAKAIAFPPLQTLPLGPVADVAPGSVDPFATPWLQDDLDACRARVAASSAVVPMELSSPPPHSSPPRASPPQAPALTEAARVFVSYMRSRRAEARLTPEEEEERSRQRLLQLAQLESWGYTHLIDSFLSTGYDVAHLVNRAYAGIGSSGTQLGLGQTVFGKDTLLNSLSFLQNLPPDFSDAELLDGWIQDGRFSGLRIDISLSRAEKVSLPLVAWLCEAPIKRDLDRDDPMSVHGALRVFSIATTIGLAQAILAGKVARSSGTLAIHYLSTIRRFILALTSPACAYGVDERIADVGHAITALRLIGEGAARRDLLLAGPTRSGFEKDASAFLARLSVAVVYAAEKAEEDGVWDDGGEEGGAQSGVQTVEIPFSPWLITTQPNEHCFRRARTDAPKGTIFMELRTETLNRLFRNEVYRFSQRNKLVKRYGHRYRATVDGGLASPNSTSLLLSLAGVDADGVCAAGFGLIAERWVEGTGKAEAEFYTLLRALDMVPVDTTLASPLAVLAELPVHELVTAASLLPPRVPHRTSILQPLYDWARLVLGNEEWEERLEDIQSEVRQRVPRTKRGNASLSVENQVAALCEYVETEIISGRARGRPVHVREYLLRMRMEQPSNKTPFTVPRDGELGEYLDRFRGWGTGPDEGEAEGAQGGAGGELEMELGGEETTVRLTKEQARETRRLVKAIPFPKQGPRSRLGRQKRRSRFNGLEWVDSAYDGDVFCFVLDYLRGRSRPGDLVLGPTRVQVGDLVAIPGAGTSIGSPFDVATVVDTEGRGRRMSIGLRRYTLAEVRDDDGRDQCVYIYTRVEDEFVQGARFTVMDILGRLPRAWATGEGGGVGEAVELKGKDRDALQAVVDERHIQYGREVAQRRTRQSTGVHHEMAMQAGAASQAYESVRTRGTRSRPGTS